MKAEWVVVGKGNEVGEMNAEQSRAEQWTRTRHSGSFKAAFA